MHDHIVLRVVSRLMLPFIFLYACYIQLHGEYSPGGGFQAGVIFASGYIVYCLLNGLEKTLQIISFRDLKISGGIGAFIYIFTGFVCMFSGGEFLNYYALADNALLSYFISSPQVSQQLGIVVIELGVGIAVFSTMLTIFLLFVNRGK